MSQVSPVPTSPAGASGQAPSARPAPAKDRAARTSLLKKFEPLIISSAAILTTLLLFGVFLIFTGIKMVFSNEEEIELGTTLLRRCIDGEISSAV